MPNPENKPRTKVPTFLSGKLASYYRLHGINILVPTCRGAFSAIASSCCVIATKYLNCWFQGPWARVWHPFCLQGPVFDFYSKCPHKRAGDGWGGVEVWWEIWRGSLCTSIFGEKPWPGVGRRQQRRNVCFISSQISLFIPRNSF